MNQNNFYFFLTSNSGGEQLQTLCYYQSDHALGDSVLFINPELKFFLRQLPSSSLLSSKNSLVSNVMIGCYEIYSLCLGLLL